MSYEVRISCYYRETRKIELGILKYIVSTIVSFNKILIYEKNYIIINY